MGEACRRIGIEEKHLYLQANQEARAIVDRYERHRASQRNVLHARLKEQVTNVMLNRRAEGYEGMSARDVLPHLTSDVRSARNVYGLIAEVVAANE